MLNWSNRRFIFFRVPNLQFFWKRVLKRDWGWVKIIKAPKVRSLPDIVTVGEVERLIGAKRKPCCRAFILATYSMGLRISESLALQVGDVDGKRKQANIRRGKGHKDRFGVSPEAADRRWRLSPP